jgi:propionyl-CoA synthetase
MPRYAEFHRQSIADPEAFWRNEARRIHWETPFDTVLDRSRPPFARWFCGGRTNLCHNAVDRHLADRAQQNALIYVSTETGIERRYTYAELHAEVNRMAAVMRSLGVARASARFTRWCSAASRPPTWRRASTTPSPCSSSRPTRGRAPAR